MDDNNNERPSALKISDRSFEETIRRALHANDPNVATMMKRVSAAAATLIAGKPGREFVTPEPLIQVGFEPNEHEMDALVALATERHRDLIHVSCHVDGRGGPTGMIAIVYFEDGRPRAHRRGGLLRGKGNSTVFLAGVSDIEDEKCHFVLRPGAKMKRIAGHPVNNLGAGMHRAGERWLALINSSAPSDHRGERLWVHGLKDPSG